MFEDLCITRTVIENHRRDALIHSTSPCTTTRLEAIRATPSPHLQ